MKTAVLLCALVGLGNAVTSLLLYRVVGILNRRVEILELASRFAPTKGPIE